ncbi:MAG: WbqC family protein [Chitinophagales bacterium]
MNIILFNISFNFVNFYQYLCEDMPKKLLIELPYLGNLAFYNQLTKYDTVIFEKQEFFQKSSYRNRCEISGPNGKLVLSVPIVGGKDKKQYYSQTKISYDHHWQKDHWNSLCSSYRRSPYFEYYEDKFEKIFDKDYETLFSLNLELFLLIKDLLKLDLAVEFSESYQKEAAEDIDDYRSHFLPKREFPIAIQYLQVFEDRTGFIPNLSIVDLLFNEGPNSLHLLKQLN